VIARTAQSVGLSFTSFGELTWSKGGKKLLLIMIIIF